MELPAAPESPPEPIAHAPNWQTLHEEIRCPMCEYQLRGLIEPRCPECGYRFAWKDLLDAKVRPHPYLFEHHPEANFKSFWKTAWGGLRPRKFWSTLHAGQPSKPRRLMAYWVMAMLLASLVLVGYLVMTWVDGTKEADLRRSIFASRVSASEQKWPQFQTYLNMGAPRPAFPGFFFRRWEDSAGLQGITILTLLFIAWPWMTFIILMLFGTSMRRARVRSIHVLRCILYSFDVALWAVPVLAIECVGIAVFGPRELVDGLFESAAITQHVNTAFLNAAHAMMAALLLAALWRLVVAYRRYLKFQHALATIASSQIILLMLLALFVIYMGDGYDILSRYWQHLMGF